jgi:uncharacterized membrane-anchored protein
MKRRLGVLVALLALSATASADKAKAKTPPPAKEKKAPAAADTDVPPDGSAADGSADADPLANVPHVVGPKLVDLGHNNEIDLPAGMILLEHDIAKTIVEKDGGNGDSIAALVIPADQTQTWFVQIDYADEGYVDDSDANDLDAGELLKSYQEGTAQQNQRRKTLGVPELFIDGWSEKPRYEKATHHLVWGLNAHDTTGPVINYFTRILGRGGFMSVNLVDTPDKIEKSKVAAAAVLAGTHFKTGQTYEDHKSSDKSSGMGLKALVLGGAGVAVYAGAKTGGIIALLLVLKKGIILIVAGVAAFFKKIFGGKSKNTQLPPDGPPPSV